MGACYSQCEETVTPDHLGNAARSYQQQHLNPHFEFKQQQQIRETLQSILDHPVESNGALQEAHEDGIDSFDMELKQESQDQNSGDPPARAERFSQSTEHDPDGKWIFLINSIFQQCCIVRI